VSHGRTRLPLGAAPEDTAGVEETAAAFLIASRALVGISLRSMAASDVPLTVPQHRTLALLAAGPRRVGELAESLGVNQSNASRLVDRLVAAGLAERASVAEDRRATDVRLTGQGASILVAVNEHRLGQLREVVAEMSSTGRAAAREALAEFSAAAHELDLVAPPGTDPASS
jgi:DNA-binding MarR family transcriptional regulator